MEKRCPVTRNQYDTAYKQILLRKYGYKSKFNSFLLLKKSQILFVSIAAPFEAST